MDGGAVSMPHSRGNRNFDASPVAANSGGAVHIEQAIAGLLVSTGGAGEQGGGIRWRHDPSKTDPASCTGAVTTCPTIVAAKCTIWGKAASKMPRVNDRRFAHVMLCLESKAS